MVRPPPRLRTKTGCLNCVRRRKKCDEARPSCGLCKRVGNDCVWRPGQSNRPSSSRTSRDYAQSSHKNRAAAAATDADADAIAVAEADASCRSDNAQSLETFRGRGRKLMFIRPSQPMLAHSDKQYHPLHTIPDFLRIFLTPMSAKGYKDPTPWLSNIMTHEWARNAIMAWGTCWTSMRDAKMVVPCYYFYGSAVAGLRQAITEGNAMVNSRTAFIASYFLGMFEATWSKHTDEQMYHWSAVSRILALYGRDLCRDPSTKFIFDVISETIVYNITNNLIFCRDHDTPMRLWSDIKTCFELSQSGMKDQPEYLSSPIHAGRRDIYHLLMDVFCICRQDTFSPTYPPAVADLLRRQQAIEESIDTFYGDDYPPETLDRYLSRHRIQLVCLRVLLLKLENPARCSSDPAIMKATEEALQAMMFQATTRTKLMSDGLAWALIVLLCAAKTDAQFATTLSLANEYMTLMGPALQYRTSKALAAVVARRGTGRETWCQLSHTKSCGVVHDGLDMLLQQDGIFANEPEILAMRPRLELLDEPSSVA